MKANELRIGNWIRINESDTAIQVEQYLLCASELINYRPIPLAEEWLMKFGFEKTQQDDNNSFRKVVGENEYAIVVYSNGVCEIGIIMAVYPNGYFDMGDAITKKLDYVHQLQNLYFALTGEELTITN